MFAPNMPQKCMNLQCGTFATKILRRGGVLLGGAASEYSKDIGVGEASPLLLVTDEQDHVTAIYRDISRENLDEALALLSSRLRLLTRKANHESSVRMGRIE